MNTAKHIKYIRDTAEAYRSARTPETLDAFIDAWRFVPSSLVREVDIALTRWDWIEPLYKEAILTKYGPDNGGRTDS